MAPKQKLKVFRTPIGFHDAYVAAPSRKAALRAWGSDADLFARGIAEQIDDPELMKEPLANPGEVIRRSRGSAAEQLAALPKSAPRRRNETGRTDGADAKPQRKAQTRSKPKPSREPLQKAEKALADAAARQNADKAELDRKISQLQREREALAKKWEEDRERLEDFVASERARYQRALDKWEE